MSIEIPPELRDFVEQELSAGRYHSEQDLVSAALRLLQREQEDAVAGILAGLNDIAAGRVQPLDETFSDLRRQRGNTDQQ